MAPAWAVVGPGDLAPLTNPDAVWHVLAASLRIPTVPGRTMEEATLDYLAAKRLVLVLDNCEHLVGAVARVASAIAQRAPAVAMLATSQEGLAVAGERIVAVPVLEVSGGGDLASPDARRRRAGRPDRAAAPGHHRQRGRG